jgi:hypothetical protein
MGDHRRGDQARAQVVTRGVARENWGVISGAVIERDAELGFVQAFLDEVRCGPTGLVLFGQAGIGKAILWQAGVEHAHVRSAHVSTCESTEVRAALSFLSELLDDALSDAVDSLKELAPKLFMGVSTVESHFASVYRKLGVRSRAGLAGAVGTLEV